MHDFLDEDIETKDELLLNEHLKNCKECEVLFNELKKTIALIKGTSNMRAPADFTANVIARLPKEKKKVGLERWLKNHPLLAAASLFFVLMIGSLFSSW